MPPPTRIAGELDQAHRRLPRLVTGAEPVRPRPRRAGDSPRIACLARCIRPAHAAMGPFVATKVTTVDQAERTQEARMDRFAPGTRARTDLVLLACVVCLAVTGCSKEPTTAEAKRQRGDEIVRRMSEHLARAKTFTVE